MSATSAWCAGPWKHSPTPKIASATAHQRRTRAVAVEPAARASTSSHATAQSSGISASARIRRRPSIAREIGSWASTITIVLTKKSDADLALADVRLVARERRHEVEERVAGRDEEEVQHPEPDEQPVAQHGAVGRRRVRVSFGGARVVDEREHDDVGEERRRVDEEEHGEATPGSTTLAISPPVEPAEADAEVHRHALLRERRVPARGRRQPRDQRRLARPERRRCRRPRSRSARTPATARARAGSRPKPTACSTRPAPSTRRAPSRSIERARRRCPAASCAAADDRDDEAGGRRARTRARRAGR